MTKLPRLPNAGNVLEARYTAKQMRDYGRKVEASTRERCAQISDDYIRFDNELSHLIRIDVMPSDLEDLYSSEVAP